MYDLQVLVVDDYHREEVKVSTDDILLTRKDETTKLSQRLANKDFINRAPKNIVEQEKTNYNNLKNDIEKISLTIESL